MKTANSDGGPFVGLAREQVQHWSGIAGRRFVGDGSTFATDYEAAGALTDGSLRPPCNIAKLNGPFGDALLLSMPLETAIIDADGASVFIAQVHYADEDWSFARLSRADFSRASFVEHLSFSSNGESIYIFDAAYAAEWVDNDYVGFDLIAGNYILSSALYYPDESTHCILYRVLPAA